MWVRSVQPFWRLLDTNKQTDKPNLYVDEKISIMSDFFLALLHQSKSHFFLRHGLQGTFVNKPFFIKMVMSTVSLRISSWGLKGVSGSNSFIKRLRIGHFYNLDKKWGRHFFLIKVLGDKISLGGGGVRLSFLHIF